MGTTWRGENRSRAARRRRLLSGALVGVAALLSAAAGSAEGPIIQAAGGGYDGYYWQPSSAEVGAGGAVTFKNGTAVPHGVTWTSGPENPSCTGVPIDSGKAGWSGSCTFAAPGAYSFVCYVHPTEMKGTISVSSSGTASPPPPPAGSTGSVLNGPASQALKLKKAQRGRSVRGSIGLSQAGAGARLEVDLLATRASLFGAGRAGRMLVGRLVRSSVPGGRVSFKVSLKSSARRALARRKRLRLTVKVTLTPPGRNALKLTRGVVLHV